MIFVFRTGTKVKLQLSSLEGIILEAGIRDSCVSYLVGFFENGSYTEKWFLECQFVGIDGPQVHTIGFKT